MLRCINGCIAGLMVFASQPIELPLSSISKCKRAKFIRLVEDEDCKRLHLQGKGILQN